MSVNRWWWPLALALLLLLWWWLKRLTAAQRDRYTLGGGSEPRDRGDAWWTRLRRAPDVDVSAVVPTSVKEGVTFRVQAVLAPREAMSACLDGLKRGAADVLPVAPRPLFTTPRRRALVELTVECAQAAHITPTHRRIEWNGGPVTVGFQITPAEVLRGDSLLVEVNVFVDRTCIGHLPIDLPVGREAPATRTAAVRLRRPQRVFMSYNHEDLPQVIHVARALRRFGIEPFMDRLSIEGGEQWRPRLERELERCDVFMLFWSASAAKSAWVVREARRALELNGASPRRRPRIVTHLLGPPPPPEPPAGLEHLHFNDPAYAVWQAAMSATPQA